MIVSLKKFPLSLEVSFGVCPSKFAAVLLRSLSLSRMQQILRDTPRKETSTERGIFLGYYSFACTCPTQGELFIWDFVFTKFAFLCLHFTPRILSFSLGACSFPPVFFITVFAAYGTYKLLLYIRLQLTESSHLMPYLKVIEKIWFLDYCRCGLRYSSNIFAFSYSAHRDLSFDAPLGSF